MVKRREGKQVPTWAKQRPNDTDKTRMFLGMTLQNAVKLIWGIGSCLTRLITQKEEYGMNVELKWLREHGIKRIENVAIILGALTKLEAGQFIGSSQNESEYRIAHELSQYKHNMGMA